MSEPICQLPSCCPRKLETHSLISWAKLCPGPLSSLWSVDWARIPSPERKQTRVASQNHCWMVSVLGVFPFLRLCLSTDQSNCLFTLAYVSGGTLQSKQGSFSHSGEWWQWSSRQGASRVTPLEPLSSSGFLLPETQLLVIKRSVPLTRDCKGFEI